MDLMSDLNSLRSENESLLSQKFALIGEFTLAKEGLKTAIEAVEVQERGLEGEVVLAKRRVYREELVLDRLQESYGQEVEKMRAEVDRRAGRVQALRRESREVEREQRRLWVGVKRGWEEAGKVLERRLREVSLQPRLVV